jgi:hypothetical protein
MECPRATSAQVSSYVHDQRCHGSSLKLFNTSRSMEVARGNICLSLQGTSCQYKDGSRHNSISEYITKKKSFADEMAPVGKSLEDEELVSYILVGLDFDSNPIVSAIVAHVEPIFVGELYSELLSFEARWELSQRGHQPSANVAR